MVDLAVVVHAKKGIVHGLTQADMAADLDVSASYIALLEPIIGR